MENTEITEIKSELSILKPFEIQKEELQKLADDYKNLVVTEETYDDAKKARAVCRDSRISIEKILKHNKDILNGEKGKQEDKAKELIDIISPTEKTIDTGIKEIDNKKELERKRKEEEAMKKLAERQSSLSGYEMKYEDGSYTLGDHTISAVQLKVFSDMEFSEFIEEVKMEFNKIINLRNEALEAKKKEEERLETQRKEQEEQAKKLREIEDAQNKKEADLKKQQEEFQAQQDRITRVAQIKADDDKRKLEEEQAAFLREKRDSRVYQLKEIGLNRNTGSTGYVFEDVFISDAEIDELEGKAWVELVAFTKQRVSDLKTAIKIKEEQEAIRKEEERKLFEQKASLRAEALKPDREKIAAYIEQLTSIPLPNLSDSKANTIMVDVSEMIIGIEKFVVSQLETL